MNFISSYSHVVRKAAERARRILPIVLVTALALHASTAVAQLVPGVNASLTISDGTSDVEISFGEWITYNPETTQYSLVQPGRNLGTSGWAWQSYLDEATKTTSTEMQWTGEGSDFATVTLLDVNGHIDPAMAYSFSIINNTGATQTYSFYFGATIAPTITGPYTIQADVGVTLSTTSPTATISPVGLAPKFQKLELSDDGGTTTINAGVDVGGTYTRNSNGTSTFLDALGPINGTTALTLNYWEFQTEFTLSAGDAVGISGFAEIIAIPEPSTYALFLGCTTLLVVAVRRRKADQGIAA